MCEYKDGCHNWEGKAQCDNEKEILIPFMELPNGVDGWHPIKDTIRPLQPVEDGNGLLPAQQNFAKVEGPVNTRCDPLAATSKFVQYLHPTAQQWLRFYECGGHCFQFPDFAACEEYTDKFVIPTPPSESISKRDAPQDLDPR